MHARTHTCTHTYTHTHTQTCTVLSASSMSFSLTPSTCTKDSQHVMLLHTTYMHIQTTLSIQPPFCTRLQCKFLRSTYICGVVHTHIILDTPTHLSFCSYIQCVQYAYLYWKVQIQSNLSITNQLRTAKKVYYIRVFTTSGCSLHQVLRYIRVFATSGCSLHQGVHYIRVFTTSGFIYNRVNRCTF